MYLPLAEYKDRSVYDPAEITEYFGRPGLSNRYSAWEKTLRARKIDDKLRRRYAVPFGVVTPSAEPDPALVPEAVKDWLTAYLDARFQRARREPGSEIEAGDTDNTLEATEATREIENAANPEAPAHPELPLRADKPDGSGVVKGGPLLKSYPTIYEFYDDQQRERDEAAK